MAKIHFFKLAQEIGKNPAAFMKKLADNGIIIRSPSSTIDEDTEAQIRKFIAEEPDEVSVAPAAPKKKAEQDEQVKPTEPTEKKEADVKEKKSVKSVRPQEREGNLSSAEVVFKVNKSTDGQGDKKKPAIKKETIKAKPKSSFLLTPVTDGGLSPDADFGIVKSADTAILTTRPARPERKPAQTGGQRGGYNREGQNNTNRSGSSSTGRPFVRTNTTDRNGSRPTGGATGTGFSAPVAESNTGKSPDRSAAGAKKQKRTVFTTDRDQSANKNKLKKPTDFFSTTIRGPRKQKRVPTGGNLPIEPLILDEPIIVTGAMTIADIADKVRVTPTAVITKLISKGIMATVNQQLQPEKVVEVFADLGFEALFEESLVEQADWRLSASTMGGEVEGEIRPPVVTILGHVDHGKTSLLDSIRKTNVTAGEHGGITQHIGAYQIETRGKKITFLDTPGHAAFTAMRARGANLTDIAVLVVAADDGIQPQTVEAIDHAKAAKVPIIVAVNKIDVPDANPAEVKQQLTHHELVPEEWGGETIVVELSAKTGQNIEQLLDMILLVAEVQELRAVRDGKAKGAVVESKLDKQRGSVSTMLVQQGTIKVGDAVVVGMVAGKIRAMSDDNGKPIKKAGPSRPIEIIGLPEVPIAGDLFEVIESEKKAREIAKERQEKARSENLQARVSLQNLSSMVASGVVKDLNVIVKTDVAGSIEAISNAISQIKTDEIRVNIIHAGVGDITESDVLLASASAAIIVGFHVKSEIQARIMATEIEIDVRIYTIIYDLVEDIEKAMVGMLAPVFMDVILGHASCRAIFKSSKAGVVAGCMVIDGVIRRDSKVKIRRGEEIVYEGNLDSLKHIKEDVKEMATNFECGISIDKFNAWEEGDILESYIIQESRRESL